MKVEDCVVFAKMPAGNTAVKRDRLPLGQCGVILQIHKYDDGTELYKVTFGDRFGTYWLETENLKPIPQGQEVPLAANAGVPSHFEPNAYCAELAKTQLAKHINRDAHNIGCLRTRPKYDALGNLAMLAIDVALEAPLDRASQPGYYCYINRDTVRAIRAILDDAGIPWKQQKKELKP